MNRRKNTLGILPLLATVLLSAASCTESVVQDMETAGDSGAIRFSLPTLTRSAIGSADDLNTEAAWAIVVFVLIMYYKIKTNGILSYLKGLLDPIFIMAPINVLSEVSTPVSMAFRHFGNILSGTVISTLLYWALASLSHVVFGWLPGFLSQLQLFQIGIPAFTGLYFDWFGGCIQAFIFCTLTTIFIKRAAGED